MPRMGTVDFLGTRSRSCQRTWCRKSGGGMRAISFGWRSICEARMAGESPASPHYCFIRRLIFVFILDANGDCVLSRGDVTEREVVVELARIGELGRG